MPSVQDKPKSTNQREFERVKWEDISLYDFVRAAWPVIEPGRPFVDGKHIRVICQHLEAVTSGRILRLIVNIAPRHAKSSIISVLWRVWTWIKDPSLRWLCASYKLSLAIRDNVKCRRLIQSHWFQTHYGHLFQLSKTQNAKFKFETDKFGYSQVVSVGSSATGEGGDILLIDDPHSIDDKRSDVTREGALDWFKDNWCTRLNDPKTSAMVVVGQRIHDQDLSGYILSGETGEHWVHLNLATEYEPGDKCITTYPDGSPLWGDWRELEGELLWPERFPREIVERAKRRHGPMGYAALYQQRPVPATGSVFDPKKERQFTRGPDAYFLETPKGVRAVPVSECWHFATVDLAISEKQSADYTVFAIWACTPIRDLLLLDVRRERWSHPEQQEQARELHQTYRLEYFSIESVAYQMALIQDLLAEGIPCLPHDPKGGGDKVARASSAAIWQNNGKVYFLRGASWLPEWHKELYKFPKASHDDQVDTYSQATERIRIRGPLADDRTHLETEEDIPAPIEGREDPLAITAIAKIDPFQWAQEHGMFGDL